MTPDSSKTAETVTSDDTPLLSESLANRRRFAVQMRIDGSPLKTITQTTGLSAPTVIAAFKAWNTGGWKAIEPAPRGRAAGSRQLDDAQQTQLQRVLLTSPPNDGDSPLWHVGNAHNYLTETGVSLTPRSVTRYLALWGLTPPPRKFDAETASDCVPVPTPVYRVTVSTADGRSVFATRDPRGKLHWIGFDGPPTTDRIIDFLNRLTRLGSSRSRSIVIKGIDIARTNAIRAWITENCCNTDVFTASAASLTKISALAPQAQHAASVDQGNEQQNDLNVSRLTMNQSSTARQTEPVPTMTDSNTAASINTTSSATADGLLPGSDTLTHLQRLEAESIHIMREVVAEADNPVMMYSIGKDSAVMLHLAAKAFYPAPPPFPLLHVDTTWKFRAMYEFRDRIAKELGFELLVHINQEGVAQGVNPFTHGSALHTDIMKTEALKQALDKYQFDVAFGGARRDEEKSRAKERIFSFRSAQHRWEPKAQRPELWRQYNTRKQKSESIRVFPLSNWTELDIWQYIYRESIPIVPLYYAGERPVVERDGTLIMVDDDRMPLHDGEVPQMRSVRFRTLGCYPLTGAVESTAATLPDIIQEMLLTKTSERQGRMIDHDNAASMEKKKQEGYF